MGKPKKNSIFYILASFYGIITEVRNRMFDLGILKSRSFDLPVISLGNLAVGGTGKTPHAEFLIQHLSKKFKIAVLSRGYKRETTGFVLANQNSTAKTIGDEPFQVFRKFPNLTVAVDEKRVRGIEKLLELNSEKDVIILDDAFQHRYVKAGLSILLTDFSNLFENDFMLPYGTLREWKRNSKRADIIVVTKCPIETQQSEFELIENTLNIKSHQRLFFSGFTYGEIYPVFPELNESSLERMNEETSILLITGIVKPELIVSYLQSYTNKIETKFFQDHHDYTKKDLEKVEKEFENLKGEKIIVTTEKDAARLKSNTYLSDKIKQNIYALPLQVKILNNEQDIFIQKIENYVRKNSGNS